MKQSLLFSKTSKTKQADATSINHDLLTRAGYVDQLMAGVYSYLPLGWKVLDRVSDIVREEMNAIHGQEILLPALHPKKNWEQTGRWNKMDVLFKLDSQTNSEYALGPTHEEVIVPLAKRFIASYRDLPRAWYQIQVKFRDELRAKAGLLRGREFLMKDLYSFHASKEDLQTYYEQSKQAYLNVFKRCGLDALVVEASGGSFTDDYSHEFQVATPSGEDLVYHCPACNFAQNKEIAQVKAGDACPSCGKPIEEIKTIEVGNIFDLGTKFSKDFGVTFTDEDGSEKEVVIGCYGIGISRVLGAIVEVHHDEGGIMWPEEIAPYQYHLLTLGDDEDVLKQSEELYTELTNAGHTVLWDDRAGVRPGEKLADADLLGMPVRLVVSSKTDGKIEMKRRNEDTVEIVNVDRVIESGNSRS